MPTDRVFMFPGKAQLKIMAGNSFVNCNRSRIFRGRTPEVTEVPCKLGHVTDAILAQTRWRREIVHLTEALQRAQIFRHGSKRVVLDPIRDGKDVAVSQKLPDP